MDRQRISLADVLNIAMLTLTLLSVFLAWRALRVAQITLASADESARSQQAQAEQERLRSQAQFQQQLFEAQKTRDALDKSRGMLEKQSKFLESLQATSAQQLKDLDAAEQQRLKAMNAKPQLYVAAGCTGEEFFTTYSAGDFPAQPSKSAMLHVQREDNMASCRLELLNRGDAEVKNLSLRVKPELPNCKDGASVITNQKLGDSPFGESINDKWMLVWQGNIPPASSNHMMIPVPLGIKVGEDCSRIVLEFSITSDNLKPLFFAGNFEVERVY